jgi:PIN domain nuclease of toxin-antitoxin system
MSVFITDTHPLVWYTLDKHSNISAKALRAFQEAENKTAFIYFPSVVLWETAILERSGKIKLFDGFLRWSERLLGNSGLGVAQLEPEIKGARCRF